MSVTFRTHAPFARDSAFRLLMRRRRKDRPPKPDRSAPPRPVPQILQDLGDPYCPAGQQLPPALFRECRAWLRWSRKKLAWEIGCSEYRIHAGETGRSVLPRASQMLLHRAMRAEAARRST